MDSIETDDDCFTPLSPIHSSLPPLPTTQYSTEFSINLHDDITSNTFHSEGMPLDDDCFTPLSPIHSSLPPLPTTQYSTEFSVNLHDDITSNTFHSEGWDFMNNPQGGDELPSLEDLFGGTQSGNYLDFPATSTDLRLPNDDHLLPVQNTVASHESNSVFSQYDNDLQSLSMNREGSIFQGSYGTESVGSNRSTNITIGVAPRRPREFGQRSSKYRGVSKHRSTGKYEAHLWDNCSKDEAQGKTGHQVYLGGYDDEDIAGRAYDLAALKYWGTSAATNFPVSNYAKELEEMKQATKQEYIASIRRMSIGFSRGASGYRGVTVHNQLGKWQARIGRVLAKKDLYLGTFDSQEEVARVYDIAAIRFRGLDAVTNFHISSYDVKRILESNDLPVDKEVARRIIEAQTETSKKRKETKVRRSRFQYGNSSSTSTTITTQEACPVMQQIEETQPCLAPQNQLYQNPYSPLLQSGLNSQLFYTGYLDRNPISVNGTMNLIGSSVSMMGDINGNNSTSYGGGYDNWDWNNGRSDDGGEYSRR